MWWGRRLVAGSSVAVACQKISVRSKCKHQKDISGIPRLRASQTTGTVHVDLEDAGIACT
ncbi:hypothetical protein PF005_g8826 [Phytophthora fragariae]|uniref:Uncharacterized protein n=1 Tax=Phytophthora fragariae TaxID=53985 RepID=A0A6A3ZKA7_9STRA|nr:hypothetical protein PF003_g482 [Phytophthora fragariae]KAE8939198.1 hypothetical protein PF009_g10971 [Phytophthora fragariae]KAE9114333.1 hypothetical protein PF007_g10424 [Phytophthora fragariae]KAE9142072.1 hypothetical protein PF006_g12800 [Phytophthora fragariae]KAE9217039.1 hypothetical protein PF005_g8826 [Phytophthora fragariae]